MAVDASHVALIPPPTQVCYDNLLQVGYRSRTEKVLPVYGSGMTESFRAIDFTAVTGVPAGDPVSRKRSRDSFGVLPVSCIPNAENANVDGHRFGEISFLGEDVSLQIYQQQLEIDQLIAHHMEKVRTEIDEMRKRNSRRLIAAVHEGITKRLKTKDDEILQIGRMNWSLEEKVKSLNVENQILKELVQTNEATADALRNKLQQVLAQIQLQQQQQQIDFVSNGAKAAALEVDDAESYCGSNHDTDDRRVVEEGGRLKRWCRRCEKEESCVLLLPCRHLCVCTSCVSSVGVCPVCTSVKSAGVPVNLS